MKDKAKKIEPNSLLRIPKPKKSLGLRVPTIPMPHEDLIQPEKPPLTIVPAPEKNSEIADSESQNFGYPNDESLAILISKTPVWISKNDVDLDINIAKEKSLDIQNPQKTKKWKKYEKARSTASLFIRAAEELVNEVRHFNVENKLDMKEFFELSARAFMDSFGYPNKKSLAINIALDDRRLMITFKTKVSIINLFREYNRILNPNSEWKPKDDAVGIAYNEVDLRLIEIGIITTQSNLIENGSDTKISRFKYYTREIDKAVALDFGEETLAVMIESYRKRWREITKSEVDLGFLTAHDEE